MTKLNALKAKATNAYNKTLETLIGMFGVVFGSILAFGIVSIALTLGLMALGFSTVLLLLAIPFGGLAVLRQRSEQAEEVIQPQTQSAA